MSNADKTPSLSLLRSSQRRFLTASGAYLALWAIAWCAADPLNRWGIADVWRPAAGLRFFCLLVFGWRGLLLDLATALALTPLTMPEEPSAGPTDAYAQSVRWLYHWMAAPLAYAAVLLPLRRWSRELWDFTHPAHGILFFTTALTVSGSAALASALRAVYLDTIPSAQWSEAVLSGLIGDLIGIITIAPLLLVRVRPTLHRYLWQGGRRCLQTPATISDHGPDLRTVLLTLSALLLIFGVPWSLGCNPYLPLIALLLLLPLAWVALYYSLREAVLNVAAINSGLVLLMALFQRSGDVLQYQWVMIAVALTGLLLGGAVEARNRIIVRYRDFAGVSNDLLWEIDADGRLRETGGRLAEHVALTPGQHWRLLLSEEAQPNLAALESTLNRRQPFHHLEIALRSPGGVSRWFQLNGLPLLDESDELVGYRGTAVDVTRQRRAEALLSSYNEELLREVSERTRVLHQINGELVVKERHLQVLLAAAPVGMLELDDAQRCRYINANGCALTGCTPDQAQGRHVLEFVHPDDRDYVEFIWQINRQSDEVQWLEFRLNHTDLWCAAHWINLSNSDHALNGAIMVLTNATARRQQDERLWTLAHHDVLTDLPNRSLFWDRLGQALRRAKRRESGAAVLWIDLDGFKAVNDHFGHAAGDALLQQAAQRLKNRMRASDTVARMGGDEFAVILPDISEGESESAMRVAAELTTGLAEPFELPQGTAHISGSIGVALYPQHAETAETLTQYADMAMYAAKHAGKNQVHMWNGEQVEAK